jgi:hypothetical protein
VQFVSSRLLFLAELFEARIAAERIEHWIEPEQSGVSGVVEGLAVEQRDGVSDANGRSRGEAYLAGVSAARLPEGLGRAGDVVWSPAFRRLAFGGQ